MRKAILIMFTGWTLLSIPLAAKDDRAASGRLIATGWDAPSPAKFREGLSQFERWGVFDGTTIAPTRKQADGRTVNSRNAFGREHWDWSEFAEAVRDLREAKPTTATNNFLFLYANPGNVDWFDDEGWREVVDHWRLLARLKLSAAQFVSPQNRARFRTQYDVGHGIYLDAHVNPPTSPWYIDRLGGTSAARLKANVSSALAASDGFVWIYGERGRWWPGASEKYPRWPEKFKNADLALRHAKDPTGAARDVLAGAEPRDNRLQNGTFTNLADDGKPKEWWTWQDKDSRGRMSVDEGTACIAGAANAVFGQNVAVKPGETYALRCRIRSTGRGFACLTAGWKDAKDKWTQESARRRFAPLSGSDASGWHEALGEVQVPPGATQLIFMLSVQGQLTESDRACFDDAQLARTDN